MYSNKPGIQKTKKIIKLFIKEEMCEEWKMKDLHDKWLYYFIKTE